MLILHDPDTLLHETVELLGAKTRPALESPERLKAILEYLTTPRKGDPEVHPIQIVTTSPRDSAARETLLQIISEHHGFQYLAHLRDAFDNWVDAGLIGRSDSILPECFVFPNSARLVAQPPKDIYARAGYFAFDMSSGIMDKTYISVLASANLAVRAVETLAQAGSSGRRDILALTRPPGHHCDGNRAGGYCYVNNAAVAVSAWKRFQPHARVGILDIDFHHGNGTQEIFYADPTVFYASIHGEDEFPYFTGFADEVGMGDAVGTTLNLPLKPGSTFEEYLFHLDEAVSAIANFNPDFLVLSLGFDTFRLDPLGSFQIWPQDYEGLARITRTRLSRIPAVILLEGGYVIDSLGLCLKFFLRGWDTPNV